MEREHDWKRVRENEKDNASICWLIPKSGCSANYLGRMSTASPRWRCTGPERAPPVNQQKHLQYARFPRQHRKSLGADRVSLLTQRRHTLCHAFPCVQPQAVAWPTVVSSFPCSACLLVLGEDQMRLCRGGRFENRKCCTISRWCHYLKTCSLRLRDLDFEFSHWLADHVFWEEQQLPRPRPEKCLRQTFLKQADKNHVEAAA